MVPQAVRQTQDPLPDGHVGEHAIDEVGGALGHPATAAAGTQRPALAGKRDQPVEATVAAAKPGKAAREPATLKKFAKLLLDEAGQAFPIPQPGGVGAEGLEGRLIGEVEIINGLQKRKLRATESSPGTRPRYAINARADSNRRKYAAAPRSRRSRTAPLRSRRAPAPCLALGLPDQAADGLGLVGQLPRQRLRFCGSGRLCLPASGVGSRAFW